MTLEQCAIILVMLPLLGATFVGLLTRYLPTRIAHIITNVCIFSAAILAIVLFYNLAILGAPTVHITLMPWFESANFKVNWALYVDVLTAVMLVVVTVVSALVHLYSVGYMADDPHQQRFTSYLSLFTFCMLMLVTADNFLQLFFGWEGVGLCSYLLIGFWFKKSSANAAAIKAFLVNRVGDLGFALGIFLVYQVFGSIEFNSVFADASHFAQLNTKVFGYGFHALTAICLLLFIGCMGKSAQIGLHTWLPDAMEGPTPVSALIHAATMVTAGVFLVARCSPIFEYAPLALHIVTIIGAVTCIFAASIAITQDDIKKVIAYSTCSQLGYMFFACGVSAYSAAIFHLMTHAFFKALLFLGAGSVIHAMSHEQDIKKMGGIWRLIPVTYALMWIGSLALAGIFPFAGYYSKDIILEAAFASGSPFGEQAYWLGIGAATLTAFYSWRLLVLAFHGKTKASKNVIAHVHESPWTMLTPLVILSIGAIASGYIGYKVWGMTSSDGAFWRGSILVLNKNNPYKHIHDIESWVAQLPMVVGLLGIALAYLLYKFLLSIPKFFASKTNPIYLLLCNKYYFDEIYNFLFVRFGKNLGTILWRRADAQLIDNMPNGAAGFTANVARFVSWLQTGFLYHYIMVMLVGLLLLMVWLGHSVI
jgi:NADH-quinone oxidoreductase subunit L